MYCVHALFLVVDARAILAHCVLPLAIAHKADHEELITVNRWIDVVHTHPALEPSAACKIVVVGSRDERHLMTHDATAVEAAIHPFVVIVVVDVVAHCLGVAEHLHAFTWDRRSSPTGH